MSTLHAKIKAPRRPRWTSRRRGRRQDRRDHAGPHAARRDPAAAPQHAVRAGQRLLTKKEISQLIDEVYRHCGQKETVIFADRLMGLGFSQPAGRHLVRQGRHGHPGAKEQAGRRDASERSSEYEQQYQDGLITKGEKYNKVVDAWSQCIDRVAEEMMTGDLDGARRRDGREQPINSV